jgi:predicted nucleic acid-binding Zn ribbon protein
MKRTHGMSQSKPYAVWKTMRNRCKHPTHNRYASYGGRGIKVCEEWESFDTFWADMGATYSEGLTLDRIDPDGDYCKENCRWISQKEQQRNRRNNAVVNSKYGVMTLAELAEVSGIKYQTLESRHWRGCPDDHLTDPVGSIRKLRFGDGT